MARNLRIAFFTPSFLPKCSGAEIFHHNLAVRLVERGHHISIVLPRRYLAELASLAGCLPYLLVPYPANTWSYFKRSPRFALLMNRLALGNLQRRYRFDLWHGIVAYPTGICLIDWQKHASKKNRPTPYLVRSVGDDILCSSDKKVGLRQDLRIGSLIGDIMPSVRMMIALSEPMRREYLKIGVPEERLAVIPNAIDLARFRAPTNRLKTRQEHGLAADRFLFLAVGRNHPQKDYATMLDAALHLRRALRVPFQLAIAGRDAGGLRSEVRRRGLDDIVHLLEIGIPEYSPLANVAFELPPVSMANLYGAADAFVMSSLLEGFSSALLEAMAAGLPVIVTDSPGCGDFVREKNSGWIVPPANPSALAEKMSQLLQSVEARNELAARSLQRASQFDWQVVVDRYLEIYQELLRPGKNFDRGSKREQRETGKTH
jgi:glycosyltransferase involved in cell wall biosynthesis